jgi:hypothetical protein
MLLPNFISLFLRSFRKLLIKTTNLHMLVGTCKIPIQIIQSPIVTDLRISRAIFQADFSLRGLGFSLRLFCVAIHGERSDTGTCFLIQISVLPLLYNHHPSPPVACLNLARQHIITCWVLKLLIAKCMQMYSSH